MMPRWRRIVGQSRMELPARQRHRDQRGADPADLGERGRRHGAGDEAAEHDVDRPEQRGQRQEQIGPVEQGSAGQRRCGHGWAWAKTRTRPRRREQMGRRLHRRGARRDNGRNAWPMRCRGARDRCRFRLAWDDRRSYSPPHGRPGHVSRGDSLPAKAGVLRKSGKQWRMWWSSELSGATRARARSWTGFPSAPISSCASRAATMQGTRWSSTASATS